MGCASSAPSSARQKKKQKERRNLLNNSSGGGYDVVANIFDESGTGANGEQEGVVSFFGETNFRKLSDAEDYMKSRILDPTKKTSNKFLDKSGQTWAPDAGDYLEKKLMRDKTRFEKHVEEEKVVEIPPPEVEKVEVKKTKKDRVKTIRKAAKKSRKAANPDAEEKGELLGESLFEAIAAVKAKALEDRAKKAAEAGGHPVQSDVETEAVKQENNKDGTDKEQEKPAEEKEPTKLKMGKLSIASYIDTLKTVAGKDIADSQLGSASDLLSDIKSEDFRIDDTCSTMAETVYGTEMEHDEDIYDDTGISASSLSLDDVLTVASVEDASSDVVSVSTVADRRAVAELIDKKVEGDALVDKPMSATKTETQDGA